MQEKESVLCFRSRYKSLRSRLASLMPNSDPWDRFDNLSIKVTHIQELSENNHLYIFIHVALKAEI